MQTETGTPLLEQMNEAIDATIDTIEEGILEVRFSIADGALITSALQELYTVAVAAGRLSMYKELKSEGLL